MVKSGGAVALVFVLSLLLGACASTAPILVTELPLMTRRGVQPGDQVNITFYTAAGTRLAEISRERTVDPDGELFLPFLGTVPVIGMESADIRRLLEELYGALYSDPVIEVDTNVNVNITGAVRSAGQFYVPPSATLVDVGISGGASDPSQVRLVRDGVATVIDLRPLAIRPEVLSLRVQSGDWLYVPRAQRSQTRDEISFWGSLFTTLLAAVSLIILIAQ